jgi:exopolyphosphatase / guanosine-5'-triphosphate,3'-diphosphate pyrophosphatase
MVGPTVPDDEGAPMTRVAAIDCGTNSIRLLVADVDPAGGLRDLDRRMEIVRLGQDVDRTGSLAPEALERTFAAAEVYAAAIRDLGAERTRFVATSASRDASNRQEFVDGIRERLGVEPEVVSGAEEAALSFAGATGDLLAAGAPGPYLVVDIGGGSTEFVRGTTSVEAARSVDMGCVRLTERHLHDDPPTRAQVDAVIDDISLAIDDAASVVAVDEARTLVGLAGSVTTVVALALGLDAYDAHRIHHARVSAAQVAAVTADLLAATRAERAGLAVMHPGRVDVIGGGALVLDTIMRRCGFDAVVASEHDILDGIAFSAAAR